MAEIAITLDNDTTLFHLPAGAACPRVGEVLHYHFAAWEGERAQWAEDSWKHEKALDGGAWKVVKVEHHVRRNSIATSHVTTWVRVKPLRRSSTTQESK
jgi:hypothetical protein